jgi:hypothetical protein
MDLNTWLANTGKLAALPMQLEHQRAVLAWRRILDKPVSVTFRKGDGSTLAAQTVRIESDNGASPAESISGAAPVRKVVIYGIRNHPTLPDTNIAEGYRISFGGDAYRIVDVIDTIGERQAIGEVTG